MIFLDLSNFPFTVTTTFMIEFGQEIVTEDGSNVVVKLGTDIPWQYRDCGGFYDSEDTEGYYQLSFNL
jgi:hypothetical protein